MGQGSFLLNTEREQQVVGTSGAKADQNGEQAESVIHALLKGRCSRIERQVDLCKGIYGTTIKCDFRVCGVAGFPRGLVIEVKRQTTQGSVDEKYPYLVENIRTKYPCPCIVVLVGTAMRSGAVRWLKAQADGLKLVNVYTIEEFVAWAMRCLRSA